MSRDFWTFFGLKDSTWTLNERQKRFHEIFQFHGDIRSQSAKIGCPRGPRTPIFSSDTEMFLFLNYCYWMCVNTYKCFFLTDCSFKICEKPSKFSKCLRSHWLRWPRWHGVCIVVDYADTRFSRISLQKLKKLRKCFRLFQKMVKNRMALSL